MYSLYSLCDLNEYKKTKHCQVVLQCQVALERSQLATANTKPEIMEEIWHQTPVNVGSVFLRTPFCPQKLRPLAEKKGEVAELHT